MWLSVPSVHDRRPSPEEGGQPEDHSRAYWRAVSRPGGRGTTAVPIVSRKVGAPQGRVLARRQSGRPAGKCHREQTADGRQAQARVKRCGKSAPAPGATRAARQTPLGARPSVGTGCPPAASSEAASPGRPRRWMATAPLRRRTEPRLQAGSPLPGSPSSNDADKKMPPEQARPPFCGVLGRHFYSVRDAVGRDPCKGSRCQSVG